MIHVRPVAGEGGGGLVGSDKPSSISKGRLFWNKRSTFQNKSKGPQLAITHFSLPI